MDKLIFDFQIQTNDALVSELRATNGVALMIPFGGHVESELFTGKILPGAIDIQVENAANIRHMCARYMFEGVDYTGTPCRLFVDNNGYFEPNTHNFNPFRTCPTFMTDSAALSPYLEGAHFRAEGHVKEDGLHILVFDTRLEA
ncbi:MAG: DUF3237 family protein [Faecousia sp.]